MAAVSVVIPAFNPGAFLEEALDSLQRQSFTDWEAVVVDDGSSEDLGPIVSHHPNVSLLTQSNAGASVARNRGVLASEGCLVAFMDQDDLWMPDKLRHQVDALQKHPRSGLCYCDLVVFQDGERPSSPGDGAASIESDVVLDASAPPAGESALTASLRHFGNAFVVPSTVMVRRETLAQAGLLDPWMPFTGDFDLLIRAGSVAPVVHVAAADVLYRRHQGNFSGEYDVGRRELRQMRHQYEWRAKATGDRVLGRAAREVLRRPRRLYAAQALDEARFAWRRGDKKGTVAHLTRSAAFDPRVVAASAAGHLRRTTG